MGLIIAGDRSGVGKTTVTLGILAYLAAENRRVQSFKVGPDYIDPMFHTAVTGLPCRNLDPVLTSPHYVQDCFQRHAQNVEWVVIEGVMGLFDGIDHPEPAARNDYGSTAHIARILNLPVLLVLNCSSLSTSIAAIAYGYVNLDPQVKIVGVILNQVASDRHLELLETALKSINLPILGVLRRNTAVAIPDRHLGLVPSCELANISHVFAQLADLVKTSFNWDKLFPLIRQKSATDKATPSLCQQQQSASVRIGVARDRAFNFYYQDNLDLLTQLGAELVFWSPLQDRDIPDRLHGLYFGGGFPEIFAPQLASNKSVLQQLKQLIEANLPTYAECGGLMYLCEQLIDLQKQSWPMVGIIPSTVTMQAKLTLGYHQAIALQNSPLVTAQQTLTGHEFHRSQLITYPEYPQWQLQGVHKSSMVSAEGWNIQQVHASYLHLHWGVSTALAKRFIQSCRNYQTSLY
ncbi:cobyrinic acid a,c-diamide synthase [Pleurocapsa sp. CCALA 161]|uniref:cobyrinate a,c-diamide synthase n=1 Tax=Pleurocapsa sp. CCALA 161 TaxID=2107688 RepID=UPI000D084317|nr:cobyrinate a,c-diamide synthase [Pleurocapsa sp. CCALA 161]PSB12371.1 cobyrinic acid a,c-diamide synthase [Pleurocapsa sp. CCALA 161]